MSRQKQESNQCVKRLEEGLLRSFRRLALLDQRVLLAVSGGPDSLTLLSAAHAIASRRVGLELSAATVDHRLRAESTAEAALVGAQCSALGVPHTVLDAPVAPGAGVEARAREARYAALLELKRTGSFAAIATGHTASDQAETVLMRLSRGSALRGAAGVQLERADGVVRPLHFATRAEVEAYVTARGLPAVRDPMNDDPSLLRTRIRRDVLPALEVAAGPGATQALARFASLAGEDEAWLAAAAAAALRLVRHPDGALDQIGLGALERPLARRALAAWLEGQGVPIDAELIDEALAAIATGGTATLPGDRLLACANGRVNLEAAPPRLH